MSDDKPIQFIRSDTVAVSYETRKGLRYVSRALGMPNPDALAEQVLRQFLVNQHPTIVSHIESLDEAEAKFEKELKAKINSSPF